MLRANATTHDDMCRNATTRTATATALAIAAISSKTITPLATATPTSKRISPQICLNGKRFSFLHMQSTISVPYLVTNLELNISLWLRK